MAYVSCVRSYSYFALYSIHIQSKHCHMMVIFADWKFRATISTKWKLNGKKYPFVPCNVINTHYKRHWQFVLYLCYLKCRVWSLFYAWVLCWGWSCLLFLFFFWQAALLLGRDLGMLILFIWILWFYLEWCTTFTLNRLYKYWLMYVFFPFTGSYLVNWSPNLQTAVSDLVCENVCFLFN